MCREKKSRLNPQDLIWTKPEPPVDTDRAMPRENRTTILSCGRRFFWECWFRIRLLGIRFRWRKVPPRS